VVVAGQRGTKNWLIAAAEGALPSHAAVPRGAKTPQVYTVVNAGAGAYHPAGFSAATF
jgi:hypothetical protein